MKKWAVVALSLIAIFCLDYVLWANEADFKDRHYGYTSVKFDHGTVSSRTGELYIDEDGVAEFKYSVQSLGQCTEPYDVKVAVKIEFMGVYINILPLNLDISNTNPSCPASHLTLRVEEFVEGRIKYFRVVNSDSKKCFVGYGGRFFCVYEVVS